MCVWGLGSLLAPPSLQAPTSRPPPPPLLPTPCRVGATIPALAYFQSMLGLPTTVFGWGLGDKIRECGGGRGH